MRWHWVTVAACLFVGRVLAVELSPAELSNGRCLNCHGQSHIAELTAAERFIMLAREPSATLSPADDEPRPGLLVETEAIARSVHAGVACASCHPQAQTLPHAPTLGPASCDASCHASADSGFLQGAHATAIAKGDLQAPSCVTCHGGHDIRPARDRQALTHPLNIVKVCGDCHVGHRGSEPEEVSRYLQSVHGRAVTQAGLAVAATCADCHESHRVLPSSDPQSSVHRNHVAETCGRCHVGISETFADSIHGVALAEGNPDAPVCTDCHTAHAITRTDTPAFMRDIVAECGHCHDHPRNGQRRASLHETYRRSYHGQVMTLGYTRAARCGDCHGTHDIRRVHDPDSRLNAENRIETCRRCHPGAPPAFAQYEPHADHRDGRRFPLLHGVWLYFIVMMSAAFGFFGLHSMLWFGRSLIERMKNGPSPRFKSNPHAIRRFNRVDRINHAVVIVSFFGLALTGLPLLYSDQEWARLLSGMLGGVRSCGILHRIFGVMLIGNMVVHFVGVARRIRKHGFFNLLFGPTTMLPRWKDLTDCAGMFRWFFRGGKKPRFDRWTYWEKFDYVAEVGGSLIIGLSGLLLWFPLLFSHFFPGWIFNVAKIVHGYEALLAVGFIFTIHFFNAHLRLEKFPVDDVMFTGSLAEEEFRHERGAEYARLAASGELERLRVAPPPAWQRTIAVIAGIIAMTIGSILVLLIILAALGLL